ncbi:NAD(P)-binding protein [Massarina eburnea CBS 473.64]|uniref:Arsenite methyltransferase n=1 Tax=Massarina eburnea CBS 473.64 TaxID=1395130 RepID=A0A6A6SA58_9PLEO|nr:NAD(P)-binding protein [Massarina eburnea CBS 473.64]
MNATMDDTAIYNMVKDRYTATALAPSQPSYGNAVSQAFGYSAEELACIPADSNLGLSCGNPLALANLKDGEIVVDLGCGAGFDCFLAARKVGQAGKVFGVDMNEDMLTKARRNASKADISNVEFVSSRITEIDLPDKVADVIISNCVINLVPHTSKPLVFTEIHRLLKPGGRVAVSDLLAKRDFPPEIKNNPAFYCGCVSGASKREEYETWMREAGFEQIVVLKDEGVDLNVYTQMGEDGEKSNEKGGDGCCAPAKKEKSNGCCSSQTEVDGGVMDDLKSLKDIDLNEWASSYKIFAVKGT